MIYGE